MHNLQKQKQIIYNDLFAMDVGNEPTTQNQNQKPINISSPMFDL